MFVNATMINCSVGTPVMTAAQKFVVPVPAFAGGGQPLVYPMDAVVKGEAVGGKPILDWQGQPIGESGIVFFNRKDQAWQAVKGDGNGVVIMNQIDTAMAGRLLEEYRKFGDPEAVTLDVLRGFLTFAEATLGIGDIYSSDRGFIAKHMTPVNPAQNLVSAYGQRFGHLKRDARDVSNAVYITGAFEVTGERTTQTFLDGGVFLIQPGEKLPIGIQPNIFLKTYRLAKNGSVITDLRQQLYTVNVEDLVAEPR